ncbi:HNH endonuclease signature motif containing protein [Staphylococcus aureus]
MFTNYFGYVPGKKQIDHLCGQRLCCNPAHLEMVTHLTNQKRRAKRAKSKE